MIKLMQFFSFPAIFRVGSLAVISQSLTPMFDPYLPNIPAGIKANIIALFFVAVIQYLTVVLIYMLRHCSLSTSLRQLSLPDIVQGSLQEAATTAIWGKLGRERSKPIHLVHSTSYFLVYTVLIIVALTSETILDPSLTVFSYSVSHNSFRSFIIVCGSISYLLGFLQMFSDLPGLLWFG